MREHDRVRERPRPQVRAGQRTHPRESPDAELILFSGYQCEEGAGNAIAELRCKRALHFAAAQGACYGPADSAAVLPTIQSVIATVGCRRTDSLFGCAGSPRRPAAVHDFPAIGSLVQGLDAPSFADSPLRRHYLCRQVQWGILVAKFGTQHSVAWLAACGPAVVSRLASQD